MKILFIFTLCLNIAGSDDVTTVTGYRGRSVQIKCHYDSGYEDYNKYLCRGECPHWPGTKDIPVQSGPPVKDTRFSLYDDTTTKIFTVTITDLRAEDANTYWCVIERAGLNIYTKLQLLVKMDDPPSSTVSQSTHNTYSATTHITSPSVHPETPPATDVPGSATYILISTGVVLFSAGVIIFCRRKCQGNKKGSDAAAQFNETSRVYENLLLRQAGKKAHVPKTACKSPDPAIDQSESIYQNSSFINKQSDSIYQNPFFINKQ
ncbi:CMRF35-like molecule 5 [Silurus meridionalis]|uniref:CMRF35-like molecule 5 n=1 Tax=Silurus meridionalis TaxID=175797 RepID=UPI001EEA71F0|nr:CMRF35-like molecule 5 [Silurus meridionalis]XP_046693387.1 CMRF35-like molecule 5 [Silurus meridionalis]XP_046693388.1 CMRF35-like molecule 5 [Silurus meridionalis]